MMPIPPTVTSISALRTTGMTRRDMPAIAASIDSLDEKNIAIEG